jgi:ATPase subunit of ABC transporter with duplicated ATPase domains
MRQFSADKRKATCARFWTHAVSGDEDYKKVSVLSGGEKVRCS